MSLSTELAEFVATTERFSSTDPSLTAQRAAYAQMCRAFTPAHAPGLGVIDRRLAGVPVRCYRPARLADNSAAPCVIYLHGGGWVVGDLDSHDFITAALAEDLAAVVIAVDYRLAPEHPFPAAFDDCLAVWQALQSQALEWGVDPHRVAVAGDSAGGNLAAALCLALRDGGHSQPVGQALIYPALGGAADLPSRSECAKAPLLSRADVEAYQALYLGGASGPPSPYAAPLTADDFSQLAPAFIAVAEFDPLRDDGVYYEKALDKAGTPTQFYAGTGLVHGCLRARKHVPEVAALYAALQAALAGFLRADSGV